jgi:hypothetical protein
LKDASAIAYELKIDNDEQINKIKRWLSGVYVFDGKYDKDIRVTFYTEKEKMKHQDSGIIS